MINNLDWQDCERKADLEAFEAIYNNLPLLPDSIYLEGTQFSPEEHKDQLQRLSAQVHHPTRTKSLLQTRWRHPLSSDGGVPTCGWRENSSWWWDLEYPHMYPITRSSWWHGGQISCSLTSMGRGNKVRMQLSQPTVWFQSTLGKECIMGMSETEQAVLQSSVQRTNTSLSLQDRNRLSRLLTEKSYGRLVKIYLISGCS